MVQMWPPSLPMLRVGGIFPMGESQMSRDLYIAFFGARARISRPMHERDTCLVCWQRGMAGGLPVKKMRRLMSDGGSLAATTSANAFFVACDTCDGTGRYP